MSAIEHTLCLERILALPRRTCEAPPDLAREMTEVLRAHGGKMFLRPLQALALHDIGTCGGAFLSLDVGEGKTLISLLAPYVLDAQRPLLLLPANLIKKTAREMYELAQHWLIPNNIRMMSYQMLGLVQAARDLELYNPDVIILDESQKTKNRDAAVTRRIERFLDAHPNVKVVAMTGTIMRKSLRDFAHILRWCLKSGAPVPERDSEVDEWALALDENIENEFQRMGPGALAAFAKGDDDLGAVRRGFRKRLRETPGVVCSAESGTEVPVGISIRGIRYDVSSEMEQHFDTLRNEKLTPCGYELWEAAEVWQHAREMALGFYQIWDPPAPEPWREARKAWFQFVRGVLQRSRTWDSPEHVAQACDAGKLPGEALAAWRAIRDTFIPNPVPVWCDDSALRVCARWMTEPGIVWVDHVPFGQRLAEFTGAKYYGAKGFSSCGEFINDGDPNKAIIASMDANKEGRNLQFCERRQIPLWHRNLLTAMPEGSDSFHQLAGRTHRPGQKHDVTIDVLLGCAEHVRAWKKACASAYAVRDTVGSQNKLLIALESDSVDWPDTDSWSGARWGTE